MIDSTLLDNGIDHGHLEDLAFIQLSFVVNKNWLLTIGECCEIWQDYSQDLQAGWLFIPDSLDKVIDMIESNVRFKGWDYYTGKFTQND